MARRVTAALRAEFLRELAATGNVSEAARRCGLSRTRMYIARTENFDFDMAWEEVEVARREALEAALHRRALEGVEQPVVYHGRLVRDDEGKIVTTRRYDHGLALRLLERSSGRDAAVDFYNDFREQGIPGSRPARPAALPYDPHADIMKAAAEKAKQIEADAYDWPEDT